MKTDDKLHLLGMTVAGLLHEVGTDAVRMGDNGYIIGHHDGTITVDGEPILNLKVLTQVRYLGEDEERCKQATT